MAFPNTALTSTRFVPSTYRPRDSCRKLFYDPEMSYGRSECDGLRSPLSNVCLRQPDLRRVPRQPQPPFFTQQTVLGTCC